MARRLNPEFVRETRRTLNLSASQAAKTVGLNDGSSWRRWERNGVTGPAATLVLALRESAAVRRYLGLENKSAVVRR